MSTHTPGPWTSTVEDRDGRRVIEHAGVAVALVCATASSPASGGHYFEKDANARLIAAAPDLLDALLEAEDALAWYADEGKAVAQGALNTVRAAIAKAEGR